MWFIHLRPGPAATLRSRRRSALAVGSAGLMMACLLPALAAQPKPAPPDDPMQVLADIVLIESQCRQFNVDYGKLFAFAEANGISSDDIMPLGERRAAFTAATKRRLRETAGDRLCTEFADDRAAVIPGVLVPR